MGENTYFQKALADFTYETASGGAIRHLADSGYTVKQIMEQLDYPTPYERVRRTVWEHLVREGVILLEPPGSGGQKEKITYVKEYDSYGRASFRRVVERQAGEERAADWRVQPVSAGVTEHALLTLLRAKQEAGGSAYVSFDFGLEIRNEPERYERMLSVLDAGQRDYVDGLPWAPSTVYHKMDARASEILTRLCAAGYYQGECYFLKTGEVLQINPRGA